MEEKVFYEIDSLRCNQYGRNRHLATENKHVGVCDGILVVAFVSSCLLQVENTSRYKVNRLLYLCEVKAARFVLFAECFNATLWKSMSTECKTADLRKVVGKI
jgi:hypothetical protein